MVYISTNIQLRRQLQAGRGTICADFLSRIQHKHIQREQRLSVDIVTTKELEILRFKES